MFGLGFNVTFNITAHRLFNGGFGANIYIQLQCKLTVSRTTYLPQACGRWVVLLTVSITHQYRFNTTDPGGLEVEPSLGVRKVAGLIPSCDIPNVVKRWYKQLPCLRSEFKGECLEIWLVGPESAYNVTGWGAPVKCLRQERSSVAAL